MKAIALKNMIEMLANKLLFAVSTVDGNAMSAGYLAYLTEPDLM